MMPILDHVARATGEFRPHTVTEFFALTLARRLGDAARIREYASICGRIPAHVVLGLYRRAVTSAVDWAGGFRDEVEKYINEHE